MGCIEEMLEAPPPVVVRPSMPKRKKAWRGDIEGRQVERVEGDMCAQPMGGKGEAMSFSKPAQGQKNSFSMQPMNSQQCCPAGQVDVMPEQVPPEQVLARHGNSSPRGLSPQIMPFGMALQLLSQQAPPSHASPASTTPLPQTAA